MNFTNKFGEDAGGRTAQPGAANGSGDETLYGELEGELEQALTDFRLSVRAWSEAELSRPRTAVARPVRVRSWRLAAGWALGCALVAGGVSGGLYEQHHKAELAKIAAAQELQHQKQLAAQKAQEEEDLLARVDSDIAREVPSAMEPLAQLMDADESK